MPDIDSAPVFVTVSWGLETRRHGHPLKLTAQQRERVRRGVESLLRVGLAFDGVDVAGEEPVRVRLPIRRPGSYDLVVSLHDARPLHRRLISPRSAAEISVLEAKLREAVETVHSGVQMLPIIVAAKSVVVGTVPDELDLVPMVTDERYVMRVPHHIFHFLKSSPEARAGAEDLKHLFEKDDSTIVFQCRRDSVELGAPSALEVPAGLWERIRQTAPASVFESVQQVEDPLHPLLTRTPREDLPRIAQRDVGPEDRGPRTDERMPPPGPLL